MFHFIKLKCGFLFLSVWISISLYAQLSTISGTIRDSATNEPLPFVNISVEDTTAGTASNDDGRYSLSLPPGDYQLLFSFIGYKTEEIPVVLQENVIIKNIQLTPTDILLQEVNVYSSGEIAGGEMEISSVSLQSRQIQEITSVIPDVMRSIQSLPGIAVNNEFSAQFNVRGGNYDENLVLVNGAQVYEPFHIKEADNATIGIFHVDLMRKVNLVTGGFSARYGDRASSVLNIEYREGSRERVQGGLTLSLTNLDGYIEGPLTSNGSFIFGARKSYLEYVLSLLEVEDGVKPSFYDLQGVLSYYLSPKNKLLFEFIHAGDNFSRDPLVESSGPFSGSGQLNGEPITFQQSFEDFEDEKARYFSNLFDIQSTNFLSGNSFLKTELSYYEQIDEEEEYNNFRRYVDIDGSEGYFYQVFVEDTEINKLRIKTLEGKADFDFKYDVYHELKSGFSYQNIRYRQDLSDQQIQEETFNFENYPDTTVVQTVFDDIDERIEADSYKLAGYAEDVWQVNSQLLLNIGGRVDYFAINKDLNFSPRFSGSYRDFLGMTVRAAWGHFYQSPIYRQIAYPAASDTNTQAIRATHYILGLEREIPLNNNNLRLRVEGYYKDYDDLVHSTRTNSGSIVYSRRNDAAGFAKGIDFYAVLHLPRFYGWFSYGLLYAKEDLTNDDRGAFPRYTDQRHTLSFVGDFRLGKGWNFNLRGFYGSGFAYTPFIAQFNAAENRWEWVQGETNSDYLPAYRRVDFRLSKQFSIGRTSLVGFLDVSNAFNFANVVGYRYRFTSDGLPDRQEEELFPVIPTLGVTMRF